MEESSESNKLIILAIVAIIAITAIFAMFFISENTIRPVCLNARGSVAGDAVPLNSQASDGQPANVAGKGYPWST